MSCIANNFPNFKVFQWQTCFVQVWKLSDGGHIYHNCSSSISTCVCLSYVTSSGVCCCCSLVRTLFSSCSLEVLHEYSYPQNSSQKTANLAKLFSVHLGLYAFCINRISFFLFHTVSGFSSVFIPSCVNNQSNSVVQSFGKQLLILSESHWLVCCWERR